MRCEAPTASGARCAMPAIDGREACVLHAGDPELRRQHMTKLSHLAGAKRTEAAAAQASAPGEPIALDTLGKIRAYLEVEAGVHRATRDHQRASAAKGFAAEARALLDVGEQIAELERQVKALSAEVKRLGGKVEFA